MVADALSRFTINRNQYPIQDYTHKKGIVSEIYDTK